ncbi:MAG TPA: metal ABC transporter permease [Candidatus Aminicenantes bacterium]|nr:metal ABC transporter permease [Candidatus Aminicenantes bacterium]
MIELFQYRYFVHGVLAAVLVSISCGFIGTYIVSRRIVFITGGISHAAFGGVGIAYFFGLNPMAGAAFFAVFSAVILESMGAHMRVRRDSLIGMIWSFGMALGVLFVFLTPGYAANLMTFLFGDILTVSRSDLGLMAGLAGLVVSVFWWRFRRILYLAFDAEFARTRNVPVSGMQSLMMVLTALTVVVNIRVVGIVLVLALMTVPPATANLLAKDFRSMIPLAILFSLMATLGGLAASHILNVPSGATIVFTSLLVFFLVRITAALFLKSRRLP